MGIVSSSIDIVDPETILKSPDFNKNLEKEVEIIAKQKEELAASWMTQLLPYLGERTLEEICLPTSHDAAMSKLSRKLRYGTESTTITQSQGILGQLNCGVRRFDLRPCILKNEFWFGHYQYVKEKDVPESVRKIVSFVMPDLVYRYHGGEGCSLSEVIDDVNTFTQSHNEVIILEMSHYFNWDREKPGDEWAHLMNQEEYNRLLKQLSRLNHLYISTDGPTAKVTKLKINDLIGKGTSAVIVALHVPAGGIQLDPGFAGHGFFDSTVLDPLAGVYLTVVQTPIQAICAYLMDNGHTWSAKAVRLVTSEDKYMSQDLWSVKDVARYLQATELDKELENFSQTSFPTFIAMDSIDDLHLLTVVLRGMARVLFGKDSFMKCENGKWKYSLA